MKVQTIIDNVYSQKVVVFKKCTRQQANKWIEKRMRCDKEVFDSDGIGLFNYVTDPKSGSKLFFIWLSDEAKFDTIAHECLHCAIEVIKHIGINMSDDSEEALTHYMGYLIRQIYGKK